MTLAWLLVPPAHAADPNGKPPADPPGVVRMTDEQQKTVGLQYARADRRPITEPVRLAGSVAYDPGHVALLRPFGQARIVHLLVQPGDVVAPGQRMAELDMPELATAQQDLAMAEASVREAEAGVAVARDALRRGETLARDGSVARAEVDRRRLVQAQAVAASDNAKSRATLVRGTVKRLNPGGGAGLAGVVAPIAGVVASVGATDGEVVDASREIFTVADLGTVVVLAQVPEARASQVAVNDAVRITPTGGGRQWDGRIATLGAALDPQARTLPARIRLANPDGALRVGMFVEVVVTDALGREAVVVPSAAVQLVADKRVVFTPLGDGRFQSHDVTLGVETKDWTELRGGVPAGSQVVTQGSFELKALLQKSMLGG